MKHPIFFNELKATKEQQQADFEAGNDSELRKILKIWIGTALVISAYLIYVLGWL